ncbi:MAG: right-handed parallel beta-helix repeat-containing protein [Methanomassiliicoccales archaeon]|nr:MAG: right-handed parallel beta-helix repeat-containing protein [Methanomassiliicoccales archaeon]
MDDSNTSGIEDGSLDNPYNTIQEGVNAADSGDTVFVFNGTYNESVFVTKTINLTGEHRDTTIVDGQGSGDVIYVESDWVNISGFTVTGSGMNADDCGIDLKIFRYCSIFDNIIINNDDGIYFKEVWSGSIINNTILNNKYGIIINPGCYGIYIINNSISSNNRRGIEIDRSVDITLSGNTMLNDGIFVWGDMLTHWDSHQIDTSNTVNGKPVYYWKNQTGGKVPKDAGQVILANCSEITVEGLEVTNGTAGIELGFSSNCSIIGNNATGNAGFGIYASKSNWNKILGNDVSNIPPTIPMGIGIRIFQSNGNNITGNSVTNCYGTGIDFTKSHYNNLSNNIVISNIYRGIRICLSTFNKIIDNDIVNNSDGIYLDGSTDNSIYHNNIINNTNQAYDDSNNGNQWDNGYPAGGNYWSDFDEPSENAYDDYNGSDQNVPGSDGIVDLGPPVGGKNPYIIDSDSQDEYPLIDPIVNRTFLYEGWNLISIPFIQPDINLGIVLSSITDSYNAVQWFDIADTLDPWKHNHTLKPQYMNDLHEINHNMGFWINIIEPGGVLFKYSGTRPIQNQSIVLHPGWNQVGYPSLTSYNRTDGLNNITFGDEVDLIQWYDASTKTWHMMNENDYFVPGRGYWFHVKTECMWEVPL